MRALLILLFCSASSGFGQVTIATRPAVWTHHNDNFRTGANLNETVLRPSNVNVSQFGKLFTQPVDGAVYAQPLYVPGVRINGVLHNVVYLATMENKVYAFDADNNIGANARPLWERSNLGPPVPAADVQRPEITDIIGNIGITGTPVIDLAGKPRTMYLVARTKEGGKYKQYLHALDIADGQERPGSPVEIQGQVAGNTADATEGKVRFDSKFHNQRAGLALVNNTVYIAWAGHTDNLPYHGWIMGYDKSSLRQTSVFCVTPIDMNPGAVCPDFQCMENYGGGGIWQAGQAPAADLNGHLYFISGNGSYSEAGKNFGESFVKLSKDGNSVADWYTPFNYQDLNDSDMDLGSNGALLIPGTNLLVGGSKEGILYLVDTARGGLGMGHLAQSEADDPAKRYVVADHHHIHSGPVFWNNGAKKLIYVWPEMEYLKVYRLNDDNTLTLDQKSRSAVGEGMPGGFLSISANGTSDGILWATMPQIEDANHDSVPGILRAFNASDVTQELWNSRLIADQDDVGNFAKFCPPTISNGKVYVATFSNQLVVYGLRGVRGSFESPDTGATQDLTALGTSDWTHWSLDTTERLNHKSGANQLGNYTRVGTGCGDLKMQIGPYRFRWNDGAPQLAADANTGLSSQGIGCGFSITAPAGLTSRTLAVYVGVSHAKARIVAHLSDAMSGDYVDTRLSSDSDTVAGMYVFNYAARSEGQTLTITFTQLTDPSPGEGAIMLQAAWLAVPTGLLQGWVDRPAEGEVQDFTGSTLIDWTHWGLGSAPGLDRRSGQQLISDYTLLGDMAFSYGDNTFGFTWINGTPTGIASNTTTGVWVSGQNNGFQITAPADRNPRILTVYVGVYDANGSMVAHLSDWSAPDYVDTSLHHGAGSVPGRYRFTYRAASDNQTLTITFTQETDLEDGNVTLQAATLSAP